MAESKDGRLLSHKLAGHSSLNPQGKVADSPCSEQIAQSELRNPKLPLVILTPQVPYLPCLPPGEFRKMKIF
jgi:hypothetical protein